MTPRSSTASPLESASWSAVFFGTSMVFSALGLGVLRGAPADVARGLFFVFLLLAIAVLLRHAVRATSQATRIFGNIRRRHARGRRARLVGATRRRVSVRATRGARRLGV